jgi:single-strand DNA-binding protein
MNSVNLIGRIGQNPRIGDEQSWASFSIAINHKYTSSKGELVEHTDWITVVVFGGLVRSVEHLGKGDEVGIEGRLRSRVYEKDDERRTAIEVVAERIHFLRRKDRGEAEPEAKADAVE